MKAERLMVGSTGTKGQGPGQHSFVNWIRLLLGYPGSPGKPGCQPPPGLRGRSCLYVPGASQHCFPFAISPTGTTARGCHTMVLWKRW